MTSLLRLRLPSTSTVQGLVPASVTWGKTLVISRPPVHQQSAPGQPRLRPRLRVGSDSGPGGRAALARGLQTGRSAVSRREAQRGQFLQDMWDCVGSHHGLPVDGLRINSGNPDISCQVHLASNPGMGGSQAGRDVRRPQRTRAGKWQSEISRWGPPDLTRRPPQRAKYARRREVRILGLRSCAKPA